MLLRLPTKPNSLSLSLSLMASPSSSALNCITFKESLNNLPKSHSFGQVSLPKRSKTELSPSTYSTQLASSDTKTPIVKTSTKTNITTPFGFSSDATSALTFSDFWREVQGCSNWEHLLDPLHPLLRQEIIRYGEFVTACYKAFDLDPASKRHLNCKYGKKRMLSEIGMGDCGYEVVKYIYATPDITIQNFSSCGRWIGFVAVSSDDATRRLGRRDIIITFRGTVTSQEWVANFMSSLIPAQLDPQNPLPDVKVESGFLSLYTSDEASTSKFGIGSCREQLLSEISKLLNKYKGENISLTMTGHSMGSALALLLAYDVAVKSLTAAVLLDQSKNDSLDLACTSLQFICKTKAIHHIQYSLAGFCRIVIQSLRNIIPFRPPRNHAFCLS